MTNGSPSLDGDISADAVLKTLLVTDLVDSTKLVEKLGDARAYKVAAQHDRVARDLLPRYRGREINKTDGFLLLFERPIDAVGYALDYHQALARLSDELGVVLLTRAGIHLGEILLRKTPPEDVARGAQPLEVEGIAKPMAARVMSLARGRQTLLTQAAFELARRAAVGKKLSDPEIRWLRYDFYRPGKRRYLFFRRLTEALRLFRARGRGQRREALPAHLADLHRFLHTLSPLLGDLERVDPGPRIRHAG